MEARRKASDAQHKTIQLLAARLESGQPVSHDQLVVLRESLVHLRRMADQLEFVEERIDRSRTDAAMLKQATALGLATWVLSAATVGLFIATVVLVIVTVTSAG